MTLTRYFAGTVVALVGAIGLALSGYAISKTWSTARALNQEIPQAVERLETVGELVHRRGEIAVEVVDATRSRLSSILEMVDDLSRDQGERQVASVLDRLDAEVFERLEHAEEFIRSLQTSLESAGRAVLLLDSIPFLSSQTSLSAEIDENNLKSLASSLTEISNGLSQMTRILSSIRTNRSVDPADVEELRTALEEVDAELRRVQSDLTEFSTETTALVDRLSSVKLRSKDWIQRSASVCTLFFICFGFSQLHLLLQARRLFQVASVSPHNDSSGSMRDAGDATEDQS